jgi:drug/metabolite transporter (DMT)-like permease
MIAILGGLGAACLWATANLASSRSSKIIGASSTVAWMMLVGLVVATPFAVVSGAAIAFGFSIYGTAQAGISLPVFMAILPARVVGVACVFVPMAVAGRLQLTRRAVPLILIVAGGEVFGNVSYVLGARESIAITAVLASQFAAVAAIAAFFIFRERLTFQQRSGFVAIAFGVAVLTVVRG